MNVRAFLEATWQVLPWTLLALIAFNLLTFGLVVVVGTAAEAMPFLIGLIAASLMLGLWVAVESAS